MTDPTRTQAAQNGNGNGNGNAIMPPLLQIRDLTTHFKTRAATIEAVNGVSFSLESGRTVCVVGESGSGKSALARSIMQIVPRPGHIVSGNILLRRTSAGGATEVTDLAALDPKGKTMRSVRGREVAMVFQEPMSSLSPVHTIGAQIVEMLRLHSKMSRLEAKEVAIESLAQVRIPRPAQSFDSYSFEFSGGMRQRAMIAMALSCKPGLLIADEPTTALDVTTQAEILELIKSLQQQNGMAVIFITHDMGVVAEIADDVAVMNKGRLEEFGPADQVFHAPKSHYTRSLLASIRKLETRSHRKDALPVPITPSTTVTKPLLSIRNLTMRFPIRRGLLQRTVGEVTALTDVSLDVAVGETLGIVGESGSGKTTLGRCVLRLHNPTEGQMLFHGADGRDRDIARLSGAELGPIRRDIRMIFQDPYASLNPRMTVGQVVGEPLVVNGLARGSELNDRVAALLKRVGMSPDMMERYPHAFSGGQRQRIGIARALALQPRLIVADEPTSALDVSLRAQVLDLLLELQAEMGISYLFVSHDISVIRYMCDRVAVMHQGKVVEIDTAEAICGNPQHPYTKSLISAVPIPDPRQRGIADRTRYQSLSGVTSISNAVIAA